MGLMRRAAAATDCSSGQNLCPSNEASNAEGAVAPAPEAPEEPSTTATGEVPLAMDSVANCEAVGEGTGSKATKTAEPSCKNVDLADLDLKLSTELINRNFSNYSAWHLRTLLQQLPQRSHQPNLIDVNKELE